MTSQKNEKPKKKEKEKEKEKKYVVSEHYPVGFLMKIS
jgi:hypothetical protein